VYSHRDTFLGEGGKQRGRVRLLDRDLLMDAGVFFQSNAFMTEELIRRLCGLAPAVDGPMADIYCGVGTFAAFLRDRFPRIDLVEQNRDALALARENVPGMRYFGVSADEFPALGEKKSAYAFAVVDPPRQGLSPGLRRYLAERGPPLLAYVSCDPVTLARDCRVLAGTYAVSALDLYDFYPHTAHIETLALLEHHVTHDEKGFPARHNRSPQKCGSCL
jgi:23S rRNA (uracil1939-C5)-methyltransferase